MNPDIFDLHIMMEDKNISLIYSGPLWAEGIGEIAGVLKKRLEFDNLPLDKSQKIFSVFIEQMNNMLMYSEEVIQFNISKDEYTECPKGTIVLGKKDNNFFVQTGNIIRNESAELIKNRIDYLNSLDKTELRSFYKKQMKMEDNNPQSKGAGLGFIEIARRSGAKIEYSFKQYKEGLSFFSLYVTIGE
ncbi:MAG: SiaB family protein kinase [Treponema sp.]|nr:SiaB family protein kinase [Treponema sp.]